jgi:hypothetical protein
MLFRESEETGSNPCSLKSLESEIWLTFLGFLNWIGHTGIQSIQGSKSNRY